MLIRSDSSLEFIEISWSAIVGVAVVTVLFFLFVLGFGLKAQRLRPTTGSEGIVGETGEVLTDLNPSGSVRVHGEIWTAESTSGLIERGAKIRVMSIYNLTLRVERLSS